MTASAGSRVPTHCPYCAMQCGMDLVVDAAGRVEVEARDFVVNRGGLCQKGWTAAALLNHPERLTTPLMRDGRGDELRPVSWTTRSSGSPRRSPGARSATAARRSASSGAAG
jgi:assimilatory nitrate reductase catalytic subunit